MIRAKKRYGQNFLKDETVLETIIQSIPNDDLKIVEIGPGLGDLTKKLLELGKSVIAFEIDDELCRFLKKEFSEYLNSGKLELKCVDILEYWQEVNLLNERYRLVANLPYYIATNIVLKLLKDDNCTSITAMIQKEVADKFCAKSKDREFGALSIIASFFGERRIISVVSPESFYPPPKVVSAVLNIEKKGYSMGNIVEKKGLEEFEKFLKICFRTPRKTLNKNLSIFKKERVQNAFNTLNLEKNIRPHQLSSLDYLKLYDILNDSI